MRICGLFYLYEVFSEFISSHGVHTVTYSLSMNLKISSTSNYYIYSPIVQLYAHDDLRLLILNYDTLVISSCSYADRNTLSRLKHLIDNIVKGSSVKSKAVSKN